MAGFTIGLRGLIGQRLVTCTLDHLPNSIFCGADRLLWREIPQRPEVSNTGVRRLFLKGILAGRWSG